MKNYIDVNIKNSCHASFKKWKNFSHSCLHNRMEKSFEIAEMINKNDITKSELSPHFTKKGVMGFLIISQDEGVVQDFLPEIYFPLKELFLYFNGIH